MISKVLRWLIIGSLTFSFVHAQELKGTPGVDYPNFVTVPDSSFKCSDQEFIPGFYADLEAQCQAYHYCSKEGQETFLCPIGSIFNQAKLACDAWYNSNCTLASQLYSSNSGFLLENALKNVPLLIKLRNRAKNRLPFRVPATDVNEKITSLFNGFEFDHSSTEGSSVSNDNVEQDPDTSEESQGALSENESLEDILSRLEAKIENEETADQLFDNKDDGSEESSDNMQTNLFFDPVTEQYFVDPESSQDFDDDEFGFYDRENFAYKYGLAMQDAEDLRDFVESTSEQTHLYGTSNEETADTQFSKWQRNLEQPFRRLRRKPIYTVIQDDQLPAGTREDMDSVMDSEDITTESIAIVTDSSEPSAEINTETRQVTYTMAPFDMVEDLSRMHMTPLNITEEPMTSEEFEDAIISELIVPKIDEHDLRIIGSTSDQEQFNEGPANDASSDVQNDGYYRYVENSSPVELEYSNEYDELSESEDLNTDSRTNDQFDDSAEYYPEDERVDGGTGKSDTFVVIPDESEIPEFSEVFDTSAISTESEFQDLHDQNADEDASRNSANFKVRTNYESQGSYSVPDTSQYHTPQYSQSVEYGPGQYYQQGYFNPENEESRSPYKYTDGSYVADESQVMGSEHNQYGLEADDPTNHYMYASPSYACQQQIGYTNCMYGPQTEYPYSEYYHNPYVSNFPYGVSEDSSELPVPDEGSYSSGSPMSYVIQRDPNMNSEQFEINQNYEQPNLYQDRNLDESYYSEESLPDNSDPVLENSVDQEETYYVLGDDDIEATSETEPESVTEPPSHDSIDGVDVTGNKGETYYILDDEDEEKVMKDGLESHNFADVSENEEIEQLQTLSQDKALPSEESLAGDFVEEMTSETLDSNKVLPSDENSLGDASAESVSKPTMDSTFTHVTNGGSLTKSDRNGDVPLDSSERFGRKEEISEIPVSSHGSLPNMFLNNMAYSDLTNFGPHGFGSSLGQTMMGSSPTGFSFANGQKRSGNPVSPNVSKLSALQERIRSLKQGKFGAFKKYVSSSGSKN